MVLLLQLLWQRAAAVAAQGCVACDACVTPSCLRVCTPSCPTDINGDSAMNRDQCKHKGHDAALDIATAACKLAQVGAA